MSPKTPSRLPRRHAAVIGIDAYGHGVTALRTAAADARAVAAALEEAHGFVDPVVLVDRAATRDGILRLLEQTLPERVGADSGLVLYFAGHGVGRDDDDGPQGYLIPQDAHGGRPETWLPMARVRKALEALPCRHLLVVLDCCFAGSFRWASTRKTVLPTRPLYDSQYARYLEGRTWQVLTSASHEEEAQDVAPGSRNTRDREDADGHSPFAAAFLEALAGAADSHRGRFPTDGVITATEIYQYVYETLVPRGESRLQTPGLWPLRRDNAGDFIFKNPQKERHTRPDPPLDDGNNPWLGLSAYDQGDAPLFFGRERVIAALEERLTATGASPLITVVGASGTGKSSVVKAGLLPRLDERWTVERMPRLGEDPSSQLAAAEERLAAGGGDGPRLLVIDQFEELYTQCPDPALREAFLARLETLIDAGKLRVLLTLRSDFEPRLAASPALGRRLAGGRYLVPAFRSEELRQVIEGPAQVKALWFEPPELVGELVDEVMAMPGALPLLSFALAEMYRRARLRRRRTGARDRALTRGDYQAAGGVVGSLHRRATELYEAADGASRETLRRLFLRMVSREGGRLARRRVAAEELDYADPGERDRVRRVRDEYVAARLWVADEGWLEPAHDTLVLAWEKLLQWLAEHGSQELQRQVWRAARAWDGARRQGAKTARGLLWDGDPRLPQARAMAAELNRLEGEFVDASVGSRERRRRTSGALVAAVVAGLAALALYSANQAQLARSRLEQTKKTVREIAFVIDRDLAPIAGTARVRRTIEEKTRELLDSLQAADDLEVRYQQAVSHQKTAELLFRSGDFALAAAEAGQAAEILEAALEEAPPDDRRRGDWQRLLTRVHHDRGRIAAAKSDLEAARAWHQKGLELARRRAAAAGATEIEDHAVAVANSHLGEVAKGSGDPQQARRLYDESLETLRRDAESRPADRDWQRDLASLYGRLGVLAVEEGRFGEGRGRFLGQLEIRQRLADLEPDNAFLQDDLAQANSQLALVGYLLGGDSRAEGWDEQARQIYQRLVRAEPENVAWRRRLALAYQTAGAWLLEKDPAAAAVFFAQALEVAEALVAAAPENPRGLSVLAEIRAALGHAAFAQQDYASAGERYESAVEIFERLAAQQPSNTEWQSSLADACKDLGGLAIAEATGDWQRARRRLDQAAEIFRRLSDAESGTWMFRWSLAIINNQLGQLVAGEGDTEGARELFEEALEMAEELSATGPASGGSAYLVGEWESHFRLAQLLAETDPESAGRHASRAMELWAQVEELNAAQEVAESANPEE